MTPEETATRLKERFGNVVVDVAHFRGESTAVVRKESLLDVCCFLRDDLDFNFLSDITAVDWLDRQPRFDVVYQLTSLKYWTRFRLKVQLDDKESVSTVASLWPAANWPEREVWDLMGIPFDGHPDLRRIQLPEGWIGHPLRKDFAQSQISLPRPRSDKTL